MAVAQLLDVAVERWPIILAAVAAVLGSALLQHVNNWRLVSIIPFAGSELGSEEKRRTAYTTSAKKIYEDAYWKFKDGICRVTTTRNIPIIAISPKYLRELQRLPDDVISMKDAVYVNLEAKYTKINTEGDIVAESIKADLTPALMRLNPTIASEVEEALSRELPPCETWTPVGINAKLLRIVAMVSGRVFIGPELCHAEEYIDAAVNYTVDLMSAVVAVQRLPAWQRWFRARFLPEVRSIDGWVKKAMAFLMPVVEKRRADEREAKAKGETYDKPDDMLQWLMDASEKAGASGVYDIAKLQLGLSFAAIHTTTLTTTNAFYSLATLPDFQEELRQETREVLAENGGVFTTAALQKMKKLDSFLRETMRFDPPSFSSFVRKVKKPVTLSSGQVIPPGVMIEVPAIGLNLDSAIHGDPEVFDPLRFYRLRQSAAGAGGTKAAEAGAMNQFVSVNQNHLLFGFGRHACPGRFFAANEIKMILANTLLKYEIRNVEGIEGRIPNLVFGIMSVPDGSKELLFKKL